VGHRVLHQHDDRDDQRDGADGDADGQLDGVGLVLFVVVGTGHVFLGNGARGRGKGSRKL
jgi:hypothetical protein